MDLREALSVKEFFTTPQKPLCLFIAPLKGDDTATRERSEDVFASLVMPAAQQVGFFPEFILDDEPGTIMNHIVRSIKAARVLVADLTGNNFSVGYELAFAHMIRKPTIPLIRTGGAKPFDVQTMRAVEYDYTNRGTLRSAVPNLVEQLTRIKRTTPFVMIDNPLQNALRAVEPPSPPAPVPAPPPAPRVVLPLLPPPPNSLAQAMTGLGLASREPDSPPSSLTARLGHYRSLNPLDKG